MQAVNMMNMVVKIIRNRDKTNAAMQFDFNVTVWKSRQQTRSLL